MSIITLEDHHNTKDKPRLPQSQEDILESLEDAIFESSSEDEGEVPTIVLPSILLRLKAQDKNINENTPEEKKKPKAALKNKAAFPEKKRSNSFTRYFGWFGKEGKQRSDSSESLETASSASISTSSHSIPSNLNISIESATIKDYKRVAKTLLLAFEDDPFTNYILNTHKYKRGTTPKSVYKKKKMDLMLAYFELSSYEILTLYGKIFVIKDKLFESILQEMDVKNKQKFPFLAVSCWHKIFGENVDTYYSSITSDDLDDSDDFSDVDFFASEVLSLKKKVHPSLIKFNVFAFLNNCRSKVMKDKLPFLTKVRNDVLMNKLMTEAGTDAATPTIDIWYLADVATLPLMGGKGLGKLIINYVIDEHIMKESPKSYVYLESSNPMNRGFYAKLGFSVMASYSMKKKRYVDSEKVLVNDPKNRGVNMDAMVRYPNR